MALMLILSVPALAADDVTFSVTVPTVLPVAVDANGVTSVAADAKIVNNSAGTVKLTAVTVTPQNAWALADWSTDYNGVKVDSKQFSMRLRGGAVPASGAVNVSGYPVIAKGNSLALSYDAHVAAQTSNVSATIAKVVFTAAWDGHGPVTKIAVTTPPTKTTYNSGDAFNSAGMVVKATYVDGTTAAVSGWSVTNGTPLADGQKSVTISYTEDGTTITTTQAVTVKTVYTLSVTAASGTSFIYGTWLSEDKFNATITGTDGSSVNVKNLSSTGDPVIATPEAETVTSPGWPVSYENNIDETTCGEYTFTGASSIRITFDETSVTESPTWDYIQIYDANGLITSWGSSGKLGGRNSNNNFAGKTFAVSGDYVRITFRSDKSNVYKGFSATVTPVYPQKLISDPVVAPSTTGYFYATFSLCNALQNTYGNLTATLRLYAYQPAAYAMLYDTDSDGVGDQMVFQRGYSVESGKTLKTYYTGFETSDYSSANAVPWNGNAANITEVVVRDKISPANTAYWFSGFSKLTTADLHKLDTSGTKSMKEMFSGCTKLTTITGIERLDVSAARNMYAIFKNCSALTALDLSGWVTSSVGNMDEMFYNCSALTTLKVSNFDTANNPAMEAMFYNCRLLTSLDLSKWNTASVNSMKSMFESCRALTTLNVSGWDTSWVHDMNSMFKNCIALTAVNVSGFDTVNVEDMGSMFYNCPKLTSLNISGFATARVTDMSYMFYYCSGLTSLDVSGFTGERVTTTTRMFYYCTGITSLMFNNFNPGNLTDMSRMFYGCTKLGRVEMPKLAASSVTDMSYLFYNCTALTNLNLDSLNAYSVRDMSYMFYNCKGITYLDMMNFNSMDVTNMASMFRGCSGLTVLYLARPFTNYVTNMSYMFYGCSALTRIYVSTINFNTGSVTSSTYMFYGCSNLKGGNGTAYSASYATATYARIDAAGTPGYFTALSSTQSLTSLTAIDGLRAMAVGAPLTESDSVKMAYGHDGEIGEDRTQDDTEEVVVLDEDISLDGAAENEVPDVVLSVETKDTEAAPAEDNSVDEAGANPKETPDDKIQDESDPDVFEEDIPIAAETETQQNDIPGDDAGDNIFEEGDAA